MSKQSFSPNIENLRLDRNLIMAIQDTSNAIFATTESTGDEVKMILDKMKSRATGLSILPSPQELNDC